MKTTVYRPFLYSNVPLPPKSHQKSLRPQTTYAIMPKDDWNTHTKSRVCLIKTGGNVNHEESKNLKQQHLKDQHEKRWLRRVPDFLPVCVQDFLHSRKSELRECKSLRSPGFRRKRQMSKTPTILVIVGVI